MGITSRGYIGANNLGFAIPANVGQAGRRRAWCATARSPAATSGSCPEALQDLERFYALAAQHGHAHQQRRSGLARRPGGPPRRRHLARDQRQTVDGRFPEQLPPIQNMIASQPVGADLQLSPSSAAAETLVVTVVTEKLESRMGEEWVFDKWGVSVRKVSRAYARENQLARRHGRPRDRRAARLSRRRGRPRARATSSRGSTSGPWTRSTFSRPAHAAYTSEAGADAASRPSATAASRSLS